MKQTLSIDMIKEIVRTASLKKKEINKEKFIALMCCDYNLSRRNVVEKINLLVSAEYIDIIQNDIKENIITWIA